MPKTYLVALLAIACSSQSSTRDASTSDGPCSGGSVELQMTSPTPSAWGAMDSGQGCSPPNWLSILDDAGNEVAIGNPELHCCTLAECSTCSFESVACTTGWQTKELPIARTWDGTLFPAGRCGPSATACAMGKTCAPPGHYTARMCAVPPGSAGPTTCVDVPFTLPANSPVVGTIHQG